MSTATGPSAPLRADMPLCRDPSTFCGSGVPPSSAAFSALFRSTAVEKTERLTLASSAANKSREMISFTV